MGLDMFLNRKRYIRREERDKIKIIRLEDVDSKKVNEIIEEVYYWRKANHIHKWFVDNIQGGEDDCKEYYVSKEDLVKLLSTINEVLQNKSKASELLPTESGFFFGGTEYDKFYWKGLEETKEMLEKILKEKKDNFEYYYSSSW